MQCWEPSPIIFGVAATPKSDLRSSSIGIKSWTGGSLFMGPRRTGSGNGVSTCPFSDSPVCSTPPAGEDIRNPFLRSETHFQFRSPAMSSHPTTWCIDSTSNRREKSPMDQQRVARSARHLALQCAVVVYTMVSTTTATRGNWGYVGSLSTLRCRKGPSNFVGLLSTWRVPGTHYSIPAPFSNLSIVR